MSLLAVFLSLTFSWTAAATAPVSYTLEKNWTGRAPGDDFGRSLAANGPAGQLFVSSPGYNSNEGLVEQLLPPGYNWNLTGADVDNFLPCETSAVGKQIQLFPMKTGARWPTLGILGMCEAYPVFLSFFPDSAGKFGPGFAISTSGSYFVNFTGWFGVGDMTETGIADIVMYNPSALEGGGVFFFYRGLTATAFETVESLGCGSTTPGDECGTAFIMADVDGDGYPDIVATCPRSMSEKGELTVYHDIAARFAAGSKCGVVLQDFEHFSTGTAGLAAGDTNGDGSEDVAIAAPVEGIIEVILGKPTWAKSTVGFLVRAKSIHGPLLSEFGAAIAFSDVDNDGYSDMFVGAPSYREPDASILSPNGAVFVYQGSRFGLTSRPWTILQPVSADDSLFLPAPGAMASFGFGSSIFVQDSVMYISASAYDSNRGGVFAYERQAVRLEPPWLIGVAEISNSSAERALASEDAPFSEFPNLPRVAALLYWNTTAEYAETVILARMLHAENNSAFSTAYHPLYTEFEVIVPATNLSSIWIFLPVDVRMEFASYSASVKAGKSFSSIPVEFLLTSSGEIFQLYPGVPEFLVNACNNKTCPGFSDKGWGFGYSSANIGDLFGDGEEDVAVGLPNMMGGGCVAIFNIYKKQILFSNLVCASIFGLSADARFGTSVVLAQRHSNNDFLGVLIGAPGESNGNGAVLLSHWKYSNGKLLCLSKASTFTCSGCSAFGTRLTLIENDLNATSFAFAASAANAVFIRNVYFSEEGKGGYVAEESTSGQRAITVSYGDVSLFSIDVTGDGMGELLLGQPSESGGKGELWFITTNADFEADLPLMTTLDTLFPPIAGKGMIRFGSSLTARRIPSWTELELAGPGSGEEGAIFTEVYVGCRYHRPEDSPADDTAYIWMFVVDEFCTVRTTVLIGAIEPWKFGGPFAAPLNNIFVRLAVPIGLTGLTILRSPLLGSERGPAELLVMTSPIADHPEVWIAELHTFPNTSTGGGDPVPVRPDPPFGMMFAIANLTSGNLTLEPPIYRGDPEFTYYDIQVFHQVEAARTVWSTFMYSQALQHDPASSSSTATLLSLPMYEVACVLVRCCSASACSIREPYQFLMKMAPEAPTPPVLISPNMQTLDVYLYIPAMRGDAPTALELESIRIDPLTGVPQGVSDSTDVDAEGLDYDSEKNAFLASIFGLAAARCYLTRWSVSSAVGWSKVSDWSEMMCTIPGPPVELAVLRGGGFGVAMVPLEALEVCLLDEWGNVMTLEDGNGTWINVTVLPVQDVNMTILGNLSQPIKQGCAVFDELRIDLAGFAALFFETWIAGSGAGTHLAFSMNVTSSPFAVLVGEADHLSLASFPTSEAAGEEWAQLPVLLVQDLAGLPIVDSSMLVVVKILNYSCVTPPALLGPTEQSSIGGYVRFPSLVINQLCSSVVLEFSCPSSGIVFHSPPMSILLGKPQLLSVDVQPQVNLAGPNVAVSITDLGGNVVADDQNSSALMSLLRPPNTNADLIGNVTATVAAGVAVFHPVSVSDPGTGYRLMLSIGPFSVVSEPFDITAVCVLSQSRHFAMAHENLVAHISVERRGQQHALSVNLHVQSAVGSQIFFNIFKQVEMQTALSVDVPVILPIGASLTKRVSATVTLSKAGDSTLLALGQRTTGSLVICPLGTAVEEFSGLCHTCDAGSFNDGSSLFSCQLCPVGTYSSAPKSSNCTSCRPHSSTARPGSAQWTDCVCLPTYYPEPAAARECRRCNPLNASQVCMVDGAVADGWWRSAESSVPRECPVREACGGGGQFTQCGTGYRGHLCGSCSENFYRNFNKCKKCPAAGAILLGFFLPIFTLLLVGYLMLMPLSAKVRYSKIAILVNALQFVTFIGATDAHWPSALSAIFRLLAVFELSVDFVIPLDCLMEMSYFDRLRIYCALPVFFALFVVAFRYAVVWLIYHRDQSSFWGRLRDTVDCRAARALSILCFCSYLMVTKTVFDAFGCSKVAGEWRLSADVRILCFEDEWLSNLWLVILGILLYPIGFLALQFHVLRKILPEMAKERTIWSFGILYVSYRRRMYLWEMVTCTKRLLAVASRVLVPPGNVDVQLILLILVMFLYLNVLLFCRPYRDPDNLRLSMLSNCVQFFIAFSGLIFYYTRDADRSSRTFTEVLLYVLMAITVGLVLFFLGNRVVVGRQRARLKKQKKEKERQLVELPEIGGKESCAAAVKENDATAKTAMRALTAVSAFKKAGNTRRDRLKERNRSRRRAVELSPQLFEGSEARVNNPLFVNKSRGRVQRRGKRRPVTEGGRGRASFAPAQLAQFDEFNRHKT